MKKSMLFLLAIAALLINSVSLISQEKGDKKDPSKTMVTQLMKQLQKAELKDEQSTKIKEMFTKVSKEVAAKRTESKITAETLKKRTDARKAAKEAGKKGKEVQAAADAAMGLTPEQAKVYKETEAMLDKVRMDISKLLTAEQTAKLPKQFQTSLKEKKKAKK